MGDLVELETARIWYSLGSKAPVIGSVSGPVDSTVGATLMHEAIGNRFIAMGVNSRCMRLDELRRSRIISMTTAVSISPLSSVEADELFLSRLAGVSDPEKN